MRIRLTRNIDKQRSFVNGTLGVIERVLANDVFVLKTDSDVRVLVHRVSFGGVLFMPTSYGYAMTIRRAQGSTLDMVGLWFDHSYPADRGYAYVGASRVRRARDLHLVGKLRRTDWLPVGNDPNGGEQLHRGSDSDSTDEDEREQRQEQMRAQEEVSDDEEDGIEDMMQEMLVEDEEARVEEPTGAGSSDAAALFG